MSEVVPIERWGKDHWSLLLYIEVRCVDYEGKLDARHLRCNPLRHPECNANGISDLDADKYPTRLKDGIQENHDDWDCMWDLFDAKLLEVENVAGESAGRELIPPVQVWLTDRGWQIAHKLRRFRAVGARPPGSEVLFDIGKFEPGEGK